MTSMIHQITNMKGELGYGYSVSPVINVLLNMLRENSCIAIYENHALSADETGVGIHAEFIAPNADLEAVWMNIATVLPVRPFFAQSLSGKLVAGAFVSYLHANDELIDALYRHAKEILV